MTPSGCGSGGRRGPRPDRRHAILAHTADAGLIARSPTLPTLFEEAAAALAAFTADVPRGVRASAWEPVELEAIDLPGLAYGWLNELVTLGDMHRAAVVEATVDRIDDPAEGPPDGAWRLHGRVGLRPYASGDARQRRQVKSATFHRLAVERRGRGWTMRAYLDV
jgi:SHS2 domain-containing protein